MSTITLVEKDEISDFRNFIPADHIFKGYIALASEHW